MPFRVRLTLIALVIALAGVTPVLFGTGHEEPHGKAEQVSGSRVEDPSVRPGQTSEGVRGEMVDPMPHGRVLPSRVSQNRFWRMAPGINYRSWTQTDSRGRIRAHLIAVDWRRRGVSIDYASRRHVPDRGPLSRLLARNGALAGVNGGFFDIADTGAPLGVGSDRQRGFLHASLLTWNNAFWISRSGTPRIGRLPLRASIAEYPQMRITNVNSPRVRVRNIGIYAPKWGRSSGYRITDGQTRPVRMVVVRRGRVIANTARLNSGKRINGTVLIGRGPGADQLRQLRVGSSATASFGLAGRPPFAIGGEKVLLHKRKVLVENDSELHPRTAVGIDRDHHRILLLVVDGRTSRSRGYTLVEEARMLKHLGAEDGLNLDGGGSTTMVGPNLDGRIGVRNHPSDGSQRYIADAIGVDYRKR